MDRAIQCKMWSNRSKDTYPPQPIINYVKDGTSNNKNCGVGKLPTIPKTDNPILCSQNTLVVLRTEKLVSLDTNHFWYVTSDK